MCVCKSTLVIIAGVVARFLIILGRGELHICDCRAELQRGIADQDKPCPANAKVGGHHAEFATEASSLPNGLMVTEHNSGRVKMTIRLPTVSFA